MQLLPPLEPFVVAGPAGALHGRFELPATGVPPRALAVFGHPHPLHGGTMQNSVVVHGARALARAGVAVARFDFRGAGRSEGSFDGGRGELDDFRAVVAMARARFPGVAALIAAGFSFGSLRAYECAAAGEAQAWLGVAPPFALAEHAARLPQRLDVPCALVLAGADELAPEPRAAELAARLPRLLRVERVAGAGHLFRGRIEELEQAVARAGEALLGS